MNHLKKFRLKYAMIYEFLNNQIIQLCLEVRKLIFYLILVYFSFYQHMEFMVLLS